MGIIKCFTCISEKALINDMEYDFSAVIMQKSWKGIGVSYSIFKKVSDSQAIHLYGCN